ncbi:Peptidase M1, alanyl aminopeptidase, C-terminal [Phytophthora cactorum]|nr:Peptidase M1, alanyl aminopeptidase, C-terminal [Phytophthora cactorum]
MTTTAAKKYRFTRQDFRPLATKPLHFDMVFDITEAKAKVTLQTTLNHDGAQPLEQLKLNSKELEILSVERFDKFAPLDGKKDFVAHVQSFAEPRNLEFEVDKEDHFLCQQHGFQRIVPCIDTMDAKAYYTTTIVADTRYTNIITNGDLAPGYHTETGVPVFHPASEVLGVSDTSRHVLKYYNHKVNMAPYLFFLGVGTYETFRRTLEFPDGDTTLLEILAFPGYFKPDDAKAAVKMLHDSVLWVMVSLGPEACEHHDERKRIYELLEEREALKAKEGPLCLGPNEEYAKTSLSASDAARLAAVRAELKDLLKVWKKTGYKYTGAVYREIAMENSYYGGMENVGNTTIVSSCLCPSCRMDDKSYEYMEHVKVHEYYHNINGSQVTGQSPFEIWLNEAVTVHMERKRGAAIFGEDYSRLSEVLYMFTPAIGPLAQDKSATSLSVEPQGFNQTQELVSVVTYSKAPEFVRMVELLLGDAAFHKALDKYHTKYAFGNATSMEWIKCMEESSGLNLQNLAKTWLNRPGHPEVTYSTEYKPASKEYIVEISQTGFEDKPAENNGPWEIPIDWSLVKDGKSLKNGVFLVKTKDAKLIIPDVAEEPDFLSFARGWSFFGKSKQTNPSVARLTKQALSDPDAVNKYQAYRSVADIEKAKVIEGLLKDDKQVEISSEFTIPSRDDLSHHYAAIKEATTALLQAVWAKYSTKIEAAYNKLCETAHPGPHVEQFQERALKRHLLLLIVAGGKAPVLSTTPKVSPTAEPNKLALDLLKKSTFVTDQATGFRLVLEDETFADRSKVQEEIFEEWRKTPDMLTKYISIVSSLDSKDVGKQILKLLANPSFNPSQSSHGRTLSRCLSQIRDFSLATDEGLDVMVQAFVKIGKVNQMSAYPLLQCFDHLDRFDDATKAKMFATLQPLPLRKSCNFMEKHDVKLLLAFALRYFLHYLKLTLQHVVRLVQTGIVFIRHYSDVVAGSPLVLKLKAWMDRVTKRPWFRKCRNAVYHGAAFIVGSTYVDEHVALTARVLVKNDAYRDRLLVREIEDLVELCDALRLTLPQRKAYFQCFLHVDFMRRSSVSRAELLRYCSLRSTPLTSFLLPNAKEATHRETARNRWDIMQLMAVCFSVCTADIAEVCSVTEAVSPQETEVDESDDEESMQEEIQNEEEIGAEVGDQVVDDKLLSTPGICQQIDQCLAFFIGVPDPVERNLQSLLKALYNNKCVGEQQDVVSPPRISFQDIHRVTTIFDAVRLFPDSAPLTALLGGDRSDDRAGSNKSTPLKVVPSTGSELAKPVTEASWYELKEPSNLGLLFDQCYSLKEAWRISANHALASVYIQGLLEDSTATCEALQAEFEQVTKQIFDGELSTDKSEQIRQRLVKVYGYRFAHSLLAKSCVKEQSYASKTPPDERRAKQRYTKAWSGSGLVEDKVIYWKEFEDPVAKRAFYYNIRTGESRWEKPANFVAKKKVRRRKKVETNEALQPKSPL